MPACVQILKAMATIWGAFNSALLLGCPCNERLSWTCWKALLLGCPCDEQLSWTCWKELPAHGPAAHNGQCIVFPQQKQQRHNKSAQNSHAYKHSKGAGAEAHAHAHDTHLNSTHALQGMHSLQLSQRSRFHACGQPGIMVSTVNSSHAGWGATYSKCRC